MKENHLSRRQFLQIIAAGSISSVASSRLLAMAKPSSNSILRKPNLVYVFADQWRAQAVGYAHDKNAHTPNLDKLAAESINFTNAVSCCPVCSPHRASLITGQYPLTHGVFLNDIRLNASAVSIAEAYNNAGYETAYIGKWHLDGSHRSAFIPKQRRQGFNSWQVLDCTHQYNNSFYYADENVKLKWDGYDAVAQTRDAQKYIRDQAGKNPFALFLSWGPPHNPYQTAPAKYRKLYKNKEIQLRPNVPEEYSAKAKKDLAGYYAHIAALDDCVGKILQTLEETNLKKNTIFVFTSDHGDMLYSHGKRFKQKPWDESILVPFLLRYPVLLGKKPAKIDMPIDAPDIMPTLLGLSGIQIPATVEGKDFSNVITGKQKPENVAALIACYSPFGQWRKTNGGKEYRGIRTRIYTYVRDLNGPWLLYDNKKDPYQLNNLCGKPEHENLQKNLEAILTKKLKDTNDQFLPGPAYIKNYGYTVDENGTMPYTN
jgi:arylsulfatase A-like enzyme